VPVVPPGAGSEATAGSLTGAAAGAAGAGAGAACAGSLPAAAAGGAAVAATAVLRVVDRLEEEVERDDAFSARVAEARDAEALRPLR
jgi:hypothetical protein